MRYLGLDLANKNDIIILSSSELPCYSCLDLSEKNPECLCEGAKCLLKAHSSSNTTNGSKNIFDAIKKLRFILLAFYLYFAQILASHYLAVTP